MKKIAILGGTFDPITNAHLEICRQVRDKYDTDVLLLVAKNTRWKENISSTRDRLNMLKLALKDESRIHICDIEIKRKSNKVNYSIDAVLEIMDLYKNHKIFYIIGTDQLNQLHRWKDIDELSQLAQFLVVNRDGYKLNKDNFTKYKCKNTNIYMENISSTSIRNLESIDTKPEVIDYIRSHGLYLKPILKELLVKDRYEHSLRVATLAKKFAKANRVDVNKAYVAGLIHDCAKNLRYDKTIELLLKNDPDHLTVGKKVLHQYAAPFIAKDKLKITDPEILQAIKYHTTGHLNMTKLDKIVYCADKLEPGREFDMSFLTKKCMEDIEIGFIYTYLEDMQFIIQKAKKISQESFKLYDNANEAFDAFKLKTIAKLLDDHFGADIKIYDVSDINPLNKIAINVTCGSDRQLLAIADEIEDICFKNRFLYHHSENQYKTGWVLVDLVDIVVNLFKADTRASYDLDNLWINQPQFDLDEIINKKISI